MSEQKPLSRARNVLKKARSDPEDELDAVAVVHSVREAVGNKADILIGTHGQSTTSGTIRFARRIEKFDPLWFEEPVPPENRDEMARVARATTIPVATGERLATKFEFRELLEKQAAAILQMALGRVGGILEARKIAGMAEAYYAQIAPHLYQAADRLAGHATGTLLGKAASEIGLEETLEGDAPRTIERIDSAGSRRWQVRRSAIRMEGERLTLVVMTDLSTALRAEEREAWRRLVRVLSHEINNSLAPISSVAASIRELVDREPRPDWAQDAQRGLDVVLSRSESLRRFMAAYARLARLPPPTLGQVDVGACINDVVALESRLTVDVRRGPEVTLHADRDQLEQALINLVANAVDAALETHGGVAVGWAQDNETVEILVEDEGPGLADTENLFVPFFTTKPHGSGVGLTLSRHIAENHGGSLTLRNRLDRPGAQARLVLPTKP